MSSAVCYLHFAVWPQLHTRSLTVVFNGEAGAVIACAQARPGQIDVLKSFWRCNPEPGARTSRYPLFSA